MPIAIKKSPKNVKSKKNSINETVSIKSIDSDKYKNSLSDDRIANVTLSNEQLALKNEILEFAIDSIKNYNVNNPKPQMFVIDGDAGTGKSVILNSLFNDIQKLSKIDKAKDWVGTRNTLLVNHPEMLKLYHRISQSFPYISKTDINRPTSHINSQLKSKDIFDVVIIDEAHLLASSKNGFKRFMQDNHLEEIMKMYYFSL